MSEAKKNPYPRLVVNNKACLTIYNNGSTFTKMFLPDRAAAQEAIVEIGQRFGKTPHHDIRDC